MSDDVGRDFIVRLTAYLADLDAKLGDQDPDSQSPGRISPA